MLSKQLEDIVNIFKAGNESDSYIDAISFLFKMIEEEKEDGTFERNRYINTLISIHNRLRYKYKEDFNGPLLSWYRRYIEIYGDKE